VRLEPDFSVGTDVYKSEDSFANESASEVRSEHAGPSVCSRHLPVSTVGSTVFGGSVKADEISRANADSTCFRIVAAAQLH